MGSTKLNLLFLSMIVSLMSFASNGLNADEPSRAYKYVQLATLYCPLFHFPSITDLRELANINLFQLVEKSPETAFKSKLSKQTKKCKRIVNNIFLGLNPPVKEIDPFVFNIFWKDSYSKPHFLSHIHSFIFRLTPF